MDLQQNSGNDRLKVVLLLVITTAYQTEVLLFSLFCASRFTNVCNVISCMSWFKTGKMYQILVAG